MITKALFLSIVGFAVASAAVAQPRMLDDTKLDLVTAAGLGDELRLLGLSSDALTRIDAALRQNPDLATALFAELTPQTQAQGLTAEGGGPIILQSVGATPGSQAIAKVTTLSNGQLTTRTLSLP